MVGLLVHEWIAPTGGSENVLGALFEAFPDSDIWALWNDARDRFPTARESWLGRTPLRHSRVAALPFMPSTWRRVPARHPYEFVIASSHLFAHHVRVRGHGHIPKLSYVHTPARYIWNPEIDARGSALPARVAAGVLRSLDRRRASEITSIAANSEFVRDRIRRAWDRDARVIYPPVDVERILAVENWSETLDNQNQDLLEDLPEQFLLGASRFVRYKRLDLVIKAGEDLGVPVVLAGAGPEEAELRAAADAARVSVRVVKAPTDEVLYSLFQRALVYVFPAVEDFGIMPVEAMACGTPVIVSSVGGARESVEICGGGVAVDMRSLDELAAALDIARDLDRRALRGRTQQFSRQRFVEETRAWVREVCGQGSTWGVSSRMGKDV